MQKELDAESITAFHDAMLSEAEWPATGVSATLPGAWRWIAENHRHNSLLWNEENQARRTDVSAADIAACKRRIDQYNQKRNDAVEAIDECILADLDDCPPRGDARLNSETAGAMIDRLSILSLKIHHMREQTLRTDAGAAHVAQCGAKLQRLMTQRQDLAHCFDQLLADARQGRAYFKVYRQFKMYNDPALNPCLYGKQSQPPTKGAAA